MLKNQSEKHPIISKVKNPNINDVSFRNLFDAKSMKIFNEINEQDETVDYSGLDFIGSSKKYTISLTNFMSLGNLAENIYNRNVSLDAAKQKQGRMKNVLENVINYNPVKDNYKNQKFIILPNIKKIYKGIREFLIAFEENIFPLPKPYAIGKNEWKEKDLDREELIP